MTLPCSVLGAGSWGTALAVQLARCDPARAVALWDRHPERCAAINRDHRNPRYLKDVPLPENLVATPSLEEAVRGARLLVVAVPSHALRDVVHAASAWIAPDTVICCATKGIEEGTLDTMAAVLAEVVPRGADATQPPITVLSGPSFARELALGLPTAVVIAGPDPAASAVAAAFHGGQFRVYHTDDVEGVCVGGSLKNVLAIATGIADGLGLGLNARAALITRGLAEITRLAVARGADPLTLMGLAGMGDLVLTCTGDLSRNRRVGLALGQGRTLASILDELGEVAEGVITAKTAWQLAQRAGIPMPITEQVYHILYDGRPADAAITQLFSRDRRAERG